ncbi:MAG: UDP-N-acetylmuramoyl-L-alanine--D-glutamate ligase [bacterium]|nr:UDP-N-acetylmuramoyl-L-alanine--D-glutamate ligase [bacterium]
MKSLQEELKNKFEGKKILIVGLGLQGGGVGMVRFFSNLGAIVKVTDLKTKEELSSSLDQIKDLNVAFTLGKHELNDFLNTDFIFKGPSMPWTHEYLIKATRKGIPIDMEVAFTFAHLKCKTIGITGTRGKTTTTEMIYKLFLKTGKKIYKAGNLTGQSTIELLNKVTDNDIVILELSSWSLSGFHKKKISPNISVFTNFYPDHLNYYKNMDDYFYDKKAIYLYQNENDFIFINKNLTDKVKSSDIKGKLKYFDAYDFPSEFEFLKGEHNKENAAAAFLVSKIFNIDETEVINELKEFKQALYRQEIVFNKDNITFVNDSTSTTPTSTIKAINAFKDKPIILILGGHSKKLPFNELINELSKVNFIVLLKGGFTDEIYSELNSKYKNKISEIFDNLGDAVVFAKLKAKELKSETYLLFSPGATSFAMFKNEFDRGDQFNKYAKKV